MSPGFQNHQSTKRLEASTAALIGISGAAVTSSAAAGKEEEEEVTPLASQQGCTDAPGLYKP